MQRIKAMLTSRVLFLNMIVYSRCVYFSISVMLAAMLFVAGTPLASQAQAPVISYNSSYSFNLNAPVSGVSPANSGGAVAAQGYGTTTTSITTGTSYAGLAIDAAGNMYTLDWALGQGSIKLVKLPAGNVNSPQVLVSGLDRTLAVAVNTSGDIFYSVNGALYKLPAGGGTPAILGNILDTNCIGTDLAGNVYSGVYFGPLTKVSPDGLTKTIIGAGHTSFTGVTTDAAGNVYVACDGDDAIGKITPDGTVTVLASGFVGQGVSDLAGISVDLFGNIFFSEAYGNLWEIPAGTTTPVAIGSGIPAPEYVAVDRYGVVNVADNKIYQVAPSGGYYMSPALPAGLSFNQATGEITGTPTVITAPKTYTVSAYNASGRSTFDVTIGVSDAAASVSSITKAGTSPTNAASVSYTVTFSDAITGLTKNNFAIAVGSTAASSVTSVTGSGTTWTVVVNTGLGDGTVGLNLVNTTGISPSITATLPVVGETYTIDKTAPTLVSGAGSTFQSNNPNGGDRAKIGDVITFRMQFDDNVQTPVITIAGHPVTVSSVGDAMHWTGSYTMTDSDTEGAAAFTLDFADLAGNAATQLTNINTGFTVIFDKTSPVVTINNPSASVVGTGAGNQVHYDVIYSDANLQTLTLSSSDITLNTTGTAHADFSIDNFGTISNARITFFNITGTGTIGFTIGANTGGDKAGNLAPSAGPSATFHILTKNAVLTRLSLTPKVTLTKVPGLNYADYTASVAIPANSIKVVPVLSDGEATITVNGVAATSGVESAPVSLNSDTTSIYTTVTSPDGTVRKTYHVLVTRITSNNSTLSSLTLSPKTTLARTTGPNYADYTANVFMPATTVKVVPMTADNGATVTVNGVAATSGVESAPVSLNADTTSIFTTITAADGATKKTYHILVTRVLSNNAALSAISLSPRSPLTRVAGTDYADYTANIFMPAGTVKVVPVTADNTATVTVNGVAVTPGVESYPITLNADTTSVFTTVTAGNGVTKKTYRINITRVPSNNALLTRLSLNPNATLTKVSGPDYADYTAAVSHATSSVKLTPVTSENNATITVNGGAATSGIESLPIVLNADTTTIATTVTAADGITKKSYLILINRLAPPSSVMAYEAPKEMPVESSQVIVHQNVSPNGDGRGDAMQIDGIANYPDNKLQIMSRAGNLVYEVKGYDNTNKVFDGHSNDGKLQQAGTYFYSLEYKVGNETKRKTGYVVLKY